MFSVTARGVDAAVTKLSNANPNKLERALQTAVKRTLQSAKSDAGAKTSERYTVASSKVTKKLRVKVSGLSGSMYARGGRIPLSQFQINPKTRPRRMPPGGVSKTVVRGHTERLPRAFIQKNGEPYERVGRRRFPIKRHWGPSAPEMLSSPHVAPFIVNKIKERLQPEVTQAVAKLF